MEKLVMKLYLNEKQRIYLLEVFRAAENNAVNGKDIELARAFNDLYEKVKPVNTSYINLDRGESETVVEFCEIIRVSLDKALSFLQKDTTRSEEEVSKLIEEVTTTRDQVDEVTNQLQLKIRANP